MESPNKVLACGSVNTCLSANGRVHHREQCGRGLNYWDTTHPRRCGKACQVGHGPAAETNNGVTAAETSLPEGIPKPGKYIELLSCLCIGYLDQSCLHSLCTGLVGEVTGSLRERRLVNDRHLSRSNVRRAPNDFCAQTSADCDLIR